MGLLASKGDTLFAFYWISYSLRILNNDFVYFVFPQTL